MNQVLKIVRQRYRVVACVVALFLVLGLLVVLLRPPSYTASTSFYVASQPGADASETNQGAVLSQGRVVSYVELVTSPRVLGEVGRDLQPPVSVNDLAKMVVASSKENSVVIDVSVTATNAQRAADIANSIGQLLPAVVAELERPISPGRVSPIALRVIQPASPPATSSAVGPAAVITGALLFGLLVGYAVAMAVDALDNKVKSEQMLEKISTRPVLGAVPRSAEEEQPFGESFHSSAYGESIRQIRTALQFANIDRPMSCLAVTSSLASEGKSTTSISLAKALSAAGSKVLLVEADLRRPVFAERLNLEPAVGLTTVAIGSATFEQCVQRVAGLGVDVLTSGALPPNPSELLASNQVAQLVRNFAQKYDYVLVDTAPILPVADTPAFASRLDGVILVSRYGSTEISSVSQAASTLSAVKAHIIGHVLSMVPEKSRHGYASGYYSTREGSMTQTPFEPGRTVGSEPISTSQSALTDNLRRPGPRPRGRR